MSHGGFGGGGHGHSGGGFGHGGHHAGHVGHGLSLGGGGHHGTIIGHVLHALGIGNHGHGHGHHGVGAGHHPDQGPTWNQAMQGEKRPGQFLRVDKRPFAVLFLLIFSSFMWLFIVYNVHRAESAKGNALDVQAMSSPQSMQPAAPAAGVGSYANAEAYGQAQSQAMQEYAAQYMQAATAHGAAQMYGMSGTAYGGTMPGTGMAPGAGAFGVPAGGYGAYGAAAAPASAYGAPAAFAGRSAPTMGYYPYGPVQTGYAPTANGRARLVVAR